MEQRCPKCGLICPPGTVYCDCGWDFAAGQLSAAGSGLEAKKLAAKAKASWLCPVLAWGSQMIFGLTLRSVNIPGMALFWLAAMLTQAALIIVGLYLGAKVL